jgi:hypothetical protein
MKSLLLGSMLLGMVVCSDAEASYMDGNKFLSFCESGDVENSVLELACHGYIFGAIDAFRASMKSTGDCHYLLPPEISSGHNHPEAHLSNASTSIWMALVEAFPCPY